MAEHFDVAVAGAGIVGTAIAYECARRGARVVLLDRDTPGAHATGAAAGMLAPCSEAHEAGAFLTLARQSLDLWPDFAAAVREDSGTDPELILEGLLRVALDDAAADDVRRRLDWQAQAGIAGGSWLDAAGARELEPALTGDIRGAAWYPREGHVNSRRAVQALATAAQHRGAALLAGAEVVGPAASGAGVRLGDGAEIAADHVVLAGGAWLGALAAAFGGAVPVEPAHGQIAVLHGVSGAPRRVVYAGLHGYVVARRDGTVLAGATEEDRGFATEPRPEVTAHLHTRAQRLVPGTAAAAGVTAWTGLRPRTPDRLPLLGPLPASTSATATDARRPRTWIAGGHYRNGVLLAPATARGMAGMLLDGRTPDGWHAFDPRRFG